MKNFNKFWVAFLLFAVVFCFGFAGKCGIKELDKNRPTAEDEFHRKLHIEMPRYAALIQTVSPKGAIVYTQDPIPPEARREQLAAVDQGIDRFLQTTAGKGWTNLRAHSDFGVVMIRPSRTTADGDGGLMLKDGSPIAGTIVSLPLSKTQVIHVSVIAQNWANARLTRRVVRNEGEHQGALYNDYKEFLRQAADDRHPFYTDETENEWDASPVLPDADASLLKTMFTF